MCILRMNNLSLPVAYVYGILSIFGALFATFGNIVVLKILWMPGQKSKSSKILTSLAISDTSVGLILFPLFAGQLLSTDQLHNCIYDYTREYITTVTIGSSLMALGIVSYDRYILLTQIAKYDQIMNRKKIIVLITLQWVLPAAGPALRVLGKGPFLYCVILITLGPLIVLLMTYCLIVKCINQSTAKIASYNQAQKARNQSGDKGGVDRRKISTSALEKKRVEKRNVNLGKTVSFLIATYCVCLVPSSIWSICDLINDSHHFADPAIIQNLYVFACFAGSTNSCFNPLIYFLKQPGMKKGFEKIFHIGRRQKGSGGRKIIVIAGGSSTGVSSQSSSFNFKERFAPDKIRSFFVRSTETEL